LPLIPARELPARALHRVAGLVETRSGETLALVERLAGDVLALVGGLLAASEELVQEAAHPVSLSRRNTRSEYENWRSNKRDAPSASRADDGESDKKNARSGWPEGLPDLTAAA